MCEATGGSSVAPYAAMFLAALRGHPEEVTPLVEATLAAAEAEGQGGAVTGAHWAAAVLHNGLGRYADALAAAEQAARDAVVYVSILVVPELVEAATRTGNTDVAARAEASTRVGSCAPPTTCSPRSAWRRSPSGPAGNWPPPERGYANAPWMLRTSSRRRKC